MLENAVRICEVGSAGSLVLRDGNELRLVARYNSPAALVEQTKRDPIFRPGPASGLGRSIRLKQVIQVPEIANDQAYFDREPRRVGLVEAGYRSQLSVPIIKDDEAIGAFNILRRQPGLFTEKQVELLSNFAKQAVIAIENARLLNELRESLQQQTATADVLKVISTSRGELEPVFRAMLENATRICEAKFGTLILFDGEKLDLGAEVGTPPEYAEFLKQRGRFQPTPGGFLERVLLTKETTHTADAAFGNSNLPVATLGEARSFVGVPMLKDDTLIGIIAIYRQEVRPFTDKQITLVQNFAAQAVIAIENTRLLNELRQRTADLTESLEQQTATSEVLRVIASSRTDTQPAFEAMVTRAARLCEADFSAVARFENGLLHLIAMNNLSPAERGAFDSLFPRPPQRNFAMGRAFIDEVSVQFEDVLADPTYDPHTREVLQRPLGYRTFMAVPIIRNGESIGTIGCGRREVRPFTARQIALVQTFADQAAIAVENVRLFEAEQQRSQELNESLQQQTATADVLKIISRSTFDLKTVLDTLVESAARLCEADMTAIARQKDKDIYYHIVASHGFPVGFQDHIETVPLARGRGTLVSRVLLERKPVHIVDVLADPEYTWHEVQKRGGFRSVIGVPLLREGVPIGVLNMGRATVSEKQIELATTFADQAVIAIENVRLFDEIQDKSRQLEEASQH